MPALHCPGPAETVVPWNKSETTTDTWRAECGLTLENNQYYTSNVRSKAFGCTLAWFVCRRSCCGAGERHNCERAVPGGPAWLQQLRRSEGPGAADVAGVDRCAQHSRWGFDPI